MLVCYAQLGQLIMSVSNHKHWGSSHKNHISRRCQLLLSLPFELLISKILPKLIKRRRQKKYANISKQEINSRPCLLTKCWTLLKSSKGLQSIFNNVVTYTRQHYKGILACTVYIVTCVVL